MPSEYNSNLCGHNICDLDLGLSLDQCITFFSPCSPCSSSCSEYPIFWLDPEGAQIGGSCLSYNNVDLPYYIFDIFNAIYRRIMIILHPIATTSNRIYVSYTL